MGVAESPVPDLIDCSNCIEGGKIRYGELLVAPIYTVLAWALGQGKEILIQEAQPQTEVWTHRYAMFWRHVPGEGKTHWVKSANVQFLEHRAGKSSASNELAYLKAYRPP